MFMMICAFVFSLLFAIAIAIGPGSLLCLACLALPCITVRGRKGKHAKKKKTFNMHTD